MRALHKLCGERGHASYGGRLRDPLEGERREMYQFFFVFFMAIAFCTLSKKICLLQACEDSLLCFPPETVSLSFLHLDL